MILNIDTATAEGSVCLARDGRPLKTYRHPTQKDHAAVLAVFIRQLADEFGLNPQTLQAVAISAGPGSYTGLRVAAATAKGLCYAWQLPLIAISTLQMMANGMRAIAGTTAPVALFCPMIDARRNEVFTALYDHDLQPIFPPGALILEDAYFLPWLEKQPVYFFGSGSIKYKPRLSHPHALFRDYSMDAADLCTLSEAAFRRKDFQDTAYFEPYYTKDFQGVKD